MAKSTYNNTITIPGTATDSLAATDNTIGGDLIKNDKALADLIHKSSITSSAGVVVGTATNNTASGGDSSVVGGASNTASGSQSAIVGGFCNAAHGSNSAVIGGSQNQAYGAGTILAGGDYGLCYESNCIATGAGDGQYGLPCYTGIKNYTTRNIGSCDDILLLSAISKAIIHVDVIVCRNTGTSLSHTVLYWDGSTLSEADGYTTPGEFSVSNGRLRYASQTDYGYGGTFGLRFTVMGSNSSYYSMYAS